MEQIRVDRPPLFRQEDVAQPIEELLRTLGPRAIFGEPVLSGDTTVIPVAEVRLGFGFGGGSGRGPDEEGGGGGGSLGRGRVTPRGYICVTPSGTRYEPIVDVTSLALGAMALAATAVVTLGKLLR
ncbi:MAG: spore germination protein GerW family protein [Rhodothermales bacterium]